MYKNIIVINYISTYQLLRTFKSYKCHDFSIMPTVK